jgi:probable HAF family extracellular repeat protein
MVKRRLRIILLCVGLLIMLGVIVLLRPSPTLYRVTVLPSLGGQYTLPYAINDRGQIAGLARVSQRGLLHLFLWDRAGGMRDLGLECRGLVDINNAGQIVTTASDPNGTSRAVLWDPVSGSRFLGPPGVNSAARAINNLGQVVGVFEASHGVYHAFIWDQTSGMRDIGSGSVWAINDAGQVVVSITSRNNRTLTERTLIVEAGHEDVTTGLQVPVRGLVRINNEGWVSGVLSPSATKPGKINVVLWHPRSTPKILMQVSAQGYGTRVINDANQALIEDVRPEIKVLGKTILPARVRCYIHDPQHGRISLDRYRGTAAQGNLRAMDLNNQGYIIAAVQSQDNRRNTGVLLEPIPKWWGK